MLVYIRYVNVTKVFYFVSILALLLLPILPIIVSCIIGGIISYSSSKFKFKNIAQIIFTTIFLLLVFYLSSNLEKNWNILGQTKSFYLVFPLVADAAKIEEGFVAWNITQPTSNQKMVGLTSTSGSCINTETSFGCFSSGIIRRATSRPSSGRCGSSSIR